VLDGWKWLRYSVVIYTKDLPGKETKYYSIKLNFQNKTKKEIINIHGRYVSHCKKYRYCTSSIVTDKMSYSVVY